VIATFDTTANWGYTAPLIVAMFDNATALEFVPIVIAEPFPIMLVTLETTRSLELLPITIELPFPRIKIVLRSVDVELFDPIVSAFPFPEMFATLEILVVEAFAPIVSVAAFPLMFATLEISTCVLFDPIARPLLPFPDNCVSCAMDTFEVPENPIVNEPPEFIEFVKMFGVYKLLVLIDNVGDV
jgi:hypothetical protein